ncbi:hypothetical protein ABKP95_05680 [Bifidobacterium longum subsp. longum]|uniref:hypothetical protein n=1 Tax=Bifidobacterium longum TaxID=216816 RepID=UPI0032DFE8E7
MADPKHPRHYDEAFKRQIVQLYESGKPSRKIRRRGPTSSGPSSWATPTPGSRRPTNRIKVTIRMAYGFHHANSLIALVMLRCAGNHGASDNRDTPLLTYRRSMVL